MFPRMAKVVSRMVWHFRAWRKLFPERVGISALGESYFPKGLEVLCLQYRLKLIFIYLKVAGDYFIVYIILLYILIFHVSFCLPVNLKYCIFAGEE